MLAKWAGETECGDILWRREANAVLAKNRLTAEQIAEDVKNAL